MNVRIPVVARLGTARGSRIFVKLCLRVAPSTCAASSRSFGICRMDPVSTQTVSGIANVMYGMMRPGYVSIRCSERSRR